MKNSIINQNTFLPTTKYLSSLVEKDKSFDIYIPKSVEATIRHLCSSISSLEWSGVLFYKVKGSFEDDNVEIHCLDIFPMDIGSATFTEFIQSPDVANYMVNHPELLAPDVFDGLVH